jgi:hypothetical protein
MAYRTIEPSATLGYTPVSGSFDAVFKEFYSGTLGSLIPNLFPLLKWLKSEGRIRKPKPQGKYIVFSVEDKDGSNVGARGEYRAFPTADSVTSVQGKVPYLRGIKGRIALSFESMKFGKEGAGSFVDVLKQETNGLIRQAQTLMSSYLWGNGDGVLAKIPASQDFAAAITVTSSEVADSAGGLLIYPGTRWCARGLKILPVQAPASNYAADGGGECTASTEIDLISSDTSLTSADDIGATAAAVRVLVEHQTADNTSDTTSGSVTIGTASSFQGPQGITQMLSTPSGGSYCNIANGTYANWAPVHSHNSGTVRAFSMDLLYRLFGKMQRNMGMLNPKGVMWTNFDVLREIEAVEDSFRRFDGRDVKPGFAEISDIMVNGCPFPMKIDPKCPGYIAVLDPSSIVFAEGHPLGVDKTTGSAFRPISNYDVYESMYQWVCQLYTTARNKHAVLSDLSYTVASI